MSQEKGGSGNEGETTFTSISSNIAVKAVAEGIIRQEEIDRVRDSGYTGLSINIIGALFEDMRARGFEPELEFPGQRRVDEEESGT